VIRAERSRSIRVRASSRLAPRIAREIVLLATRRGRLLVFDIDEIEAVAEHLAEVLSPAPANVGLVNAQELAEQLGVARDWVYANAERLGGVRLGDGPRARLRFDAERAREALTANAEAGQPANGAASRRRRGRPRRKTVAAVPLIQGRSSR
jgi:hypothetical protein